MRPALAHALCLTAILQAQGLHARNLMTAADFEAFSTGQTLDYWVDGSYWGSEQHLSGRRTLDADAEGPCRKGRWFPEGDAICFEYEGDSGQHCWQFFRDGSRVLAEIVGNDDGFSSEVTLADQPLACEGPEVGV